MSPAVWRGQPHGAQRPPGEVSQARLRRREPACKSTRVCASQGGGNQRGKGAGSGLATSAERGGWGTHAPMRIAPQVGTGAEIVNKANHSQSSAHMGPNLSAQVMHASMLCTPSGHRITQPQHEVLRGPARRHAAPTPGAADSFAQRAQPPGVSKPLGRGAPGSFSHTPPKAYYIGSFAARRVQSAQPAGSLLAAHTSHARRCNPAQLGGSRGPRITALTKPLTVSDGVAGAIAVFRDSSVHSPRLALATALPPRQHDWSQ